jgi:hypothetical protein
MSSRSVALDPPYCHATNKLGKSVFMTSGARGTSWSRKIDVSNSWPHFGQTQKWATCFSFTYVDRSGAIIHCPQKDYRSDAIVVMSTSRIKFSSRLFSTALIYVNKCPVLRKSRASILPKRMLTQLQGPKALQTVPGATHLFAEPGALKVVIHHAARWFHHYLVPTHAPRWQSVIKG